MSTRTKFTFAGILLAVICTAIGAGITLAIQPASAATPATPSWCLSKPLPDGTVFDFNRTQAKASQYQSILAGHNVDLSTTEIGDILVSVCADK